MTTVKREDLLSKAKSFEIPKRLIWEAWKRVAANKGAPGVDKEGIIVYEANLGDNLFVLWNRMSSGSCHPKAVKQVLIPKGDGSDRSLGIPTVTDRIAQTAVKWCLNRDWKQYSISRYLGIAQEREPLMQLDKHGNIAGKTIG